MESTSDHRIVEGLRKREDAAFQYLQMKFQDSIRLMVKELGGSEEDTKDVFSEGVIALIRLVDQTDFRLTCKLGTLLYALCKNKWQQHLEKQTAIRNYHVRRIDAEPDQDFSEDSDMDLYQEIFWECFGKLGKMCRELLGDYLREVSPEVIAAKMNRSYGYVRKKKSLCHSQLMKLIENHADYIRIKKVELNRVTD